MSDTLNETAPTPEPCIVNLTEQMLDDVIKIETNSYINPWSKQNFKDAIDAGDVGYFCVALQDAPQGKLMGYMIALEGVDEVHLLNITVAPDAQRKGCARTLLETLRLWTRARKKEWLWLEVRQSNTRAQYIYEQFGFTMVGTRRNYYPIAPGVKEDAILMSLPVC